MDSLCTTDQDFRPKNALLNLMDQIDTPLQVNGLSMHFTLVLIDWREQLVAQKQLVFVFTKYLIFAVKQHIISLFHHFSSFRMILQRKRRLERYIGQTIRTNMAELFLY